MKTKTIGVVGVGLMGHGIATSLQRHGYSLVLLEHVGNQTLDSLLAGGAKTCTSAKQLAAQADIIILCVTGSPQVEAVLCAEDGVLEGIKAGSTVIDCSTSVPGSTQAMEKLVSQRGATMLDAAMTRTPKEAALGRLNLLVGGDSAVLQACRAVLESFAENIHHVGPIGAGHRMKLLHNYVSLGMVSLLSEAAACAQTAGVPMADFVAILEAGGGRGIALDRLRPYLLEGSTSGLSFSIGNAVKDLNYYTSMAKEMGCDDRVASAVFSTLTQANGESEAGTLLPELVRLIAQRSKIS